MRESWEYNALMSLREKTVNYIDKEKKYIHYKLLIRIIGKVPSLENQLYTEEIYTLKKMIDAYIEELPLRFDYTQDFSRKIEMILKYIKETFFLIDRHFYQKRCLILGVFLSFSMLIGYMISFITFLIVLFTIYLIGFLLDLHNYRKGITI